MAHVLRPLNPLDTRFWAVDKVILAYFSFAVAILLMWGSRIEYAGWLLFGNLAGGTLIIYEVQRPNATSRLFRNW